MQNRKILDRTDLVVTGRMIFELFFVPTDAAYANQEHLFITQNKHFSVI